MSTYIQVRLALGADTVLTPSVIETEPDSEWPGEITAELEISSDARITFNYGWDTPANVLASIDNLTVALGLLRAMVADPEAAKALQVPS